MSSEPTNRTEEPSAPLALEPLGQFSERWLSFSRGLLRRAGEEPSNLEPMLLAGFSALLYRYTGQSDLALAVRACSHGTARSFPARIRMRPRTRFGDLLAEISAEFLRASESEAAPVLTTDSAAPAELSAVAGIEAGHDLMLLAATGADGLRVGLHYDEKRFDAAAALRALIHLGELIGAGRAEPLTRLQDLPLLSGSERQQLREWNDTRVVDSAALDVHELFEARARHQPAAIALECGDELLTYEELDRRSNRLARRLRRMGVAPEALVPIALDRSPELVIALLAVLKAGGAYLPLDPTHPPERLAFIVRDSRAALAVTERRWAAEPWLGGLTCCHVDERGSLAEEDGPLLPAGAAPENLAYVIYTSGSTGRPKGVQVSRAALANFLLAMEREPGFGEGDRLLAITTPSFDIAALELLLPLVVGTRLVVALRHETGDGARLVERISTSEITTLQATPTTWRLLLESGRALPRLRALCGGEALPQDLAHRLLDRVESLWNLYGPTETTVWSCLCKLTSADRPPAIGRPIRNTRVYLLDPDGNQVPVGIAGELCIAGSGLARGYLDRPDLTAERFVPSRFGDEPGGRLYRTGDLARFAPDGTLEFLGRIDHQVKVRGFRIELGEIEAELARHPGVRSAVVAAREDGTGEKRLVAYYLSDRREDLPAAVLRAALGRSLPGFMVPSAFVRLDAFPLTASGKVDRRALPAPDVERSGLEVPYVAPRGELEQRIVDLCREVLEVERVGVRDDFFELGGDSVRGALLVNRLQRELAEPLYVMMLFEAATPAQLADYLRAHYPRSVARRFRGETMAGERVEGEVGPAEVARMKELLERRSARRAYTEMEPRNPPAVFILSPPRSGSTLLRVMLAGHPRLFSPPELHLLSWETLAERAEALTGRAAFAAEGLLRTFVELERCDPAAALARLRDLEASGLSIQALYRCLQERLGGRLLVDKTTTYGLDPTALRRAERFFEGALYIHLTRDPRASVRSYLKARMDQVYGLPFPPRQQAELVWLISHGNIVEFLAEVPPERQIRLRFEDLVRDPMTAMESVCRLLGLEPAPEMIRPYEGERMTDGLHAASRMLGDPRFHEHRSIDPLAAEVGGGVEGGPLGEPTWELAESLGYPAPSGARRAGRDRWLPGPTRSVREHPLPLSFAQERLWLLDRLLPGSSAYNVPLGLRLCGKLDHRALRRAVGEVLRRHEVLRTTFPEVEGQPVQAIAPAAEPELSWIDLAGIGSGGEESRRLSRVEAGHPFELGRGPLLRAALVRLDEVEHLLLLTTHHIACDGWSQGILVRELCALYEAFAAGNGSPLGEPAVQYADFAVWQRGWLKGELLESQLRYWSERLASPTSLELPADRPRPVPSSFRGAERSLRLPPLLYEALRTLGCGRGATPFMVVLALFEVLLHRYSGETDLIVGTPVANRNRAEIEGLIGFFANTLALRTDLSGRPSFLDLVGRVRETALAAYAHQDLPFEKLVQELQPQRDLSRNPLFQVLFSLQSFVFRAVRLSGIEVELVGSQHDTAKFDLTLVVVEDERGPIARLEYSSELFDGATAMRLLEHFRSVAEGAIAGPERGIGELPLLARAERHQVVREWNDTATPPSPRRCLHQVIEEQADRAPDAIAAEQGDERLSYGTMDLLANRLARRLRKLGVVPEQRVALGMERSLDALIGMLAILKAGGVYVPVDPAAPSERLPDLLRGARVLLVRASTLAAWGELPSGLEVVCSPFDGTRGEGGGRLETSEIGLTPGHLAYVFHTSGTTGKPKAVGVEHGPAFDYVQAARRSYGFAPGDRLLQFAAWSFDASVEQIFPTLAAGASLVLRPEELWSPAELSLELARSAVTVVWLPPAYLQQIELEWGARAPLELDLLLRLAVTGGEAMAPEVPRLWDALRASLGPRGGPPLLNAYGPTEAVVAATLYPASPDAARRGSGPVPIGRPGANRWALVLDREGHVVPAGVPGEVCLGGLLARGYLGSPELTAERFVPDPWSGEAGARLYRTGDRARWRSDGAIEFLGRFDHQVKIRGFRVELGDIEAALCQHPDVRQAAVVTTEDAAGELCLIAHVGVGALLASGPTPVELRSFLGKRLPAYMVPQTFEVSDTLPTTPSGKLDRRALRRAQVQPVDDAFVGPRSRVEEVVASVWSDILGIERIGIDENFFALGGHSLKAIQMVSQLSRIFLVDLPTRALFEAPTVSSLSGLLCADPVQAQRIEQAAELWLRVSLLSGADVRALLEERGVPS